MKPETVYKNIYINDILFTTMHYPKWLHLKPVVKLKKCIQLFLSDQQKLIYHYIEAKFKKHQHI